MKEKAMLSPFIVDKIKQYLKSNHIANLTTGQTHYFRVGLWEIIDRCGIRYTSYEQVKSTLKQECDWVETCKLYGEIAFRYKEDDSECKK